MTKKSSEKFDIIFIGRTPASLAAAACAQKLGSSALIIRVDGYSDFSLSTDCPPNFVWRLLNLSQRNLELNPVEALVSSSGTNNYFYAYEKTEDTVRALCDRDGAAADIWADFLRSCKKNDAVAATQHDGAMLRDTGAQSPHHHALLMSANEVLDSYFDNEETKAHIAGIALMQFGLSGDEPGSAQALSAGFANASWRATPKQGVNALESTFARICKELGVKVTSDRILDIDLSADTIAKLHLSGGITLAAPTIIVAENALAGELGIAVNAYGSPLVDVDTAKATIAISYSRRVDLLSGVNDGLHFSSPLGRRSLRMAKDAAREGRIMDAPPIFFEAAGRVINVAVPYLPRRILTDHEWRDWTGQDKQALGTQIFDQVAPHIKEGRSQILSIDVSVSAPRERLLGRSRPFVDPRILMPAPHHNKIEALVSLALEVLGYE